MTNDDLAARPQNSEILKNLTAKVDFFETELAKGIDVAKAEHHVVFDTFANADLTELAAMRDVCVRLFRVLGVHLRIDLVRQGADRQRFWNGILMEAAPLKQWNRA
jgi:hypothetical protein